MNEVELLKGQVSVLQAQVKEMQEEMHSLAQGLIKALQANSARLSLMEDEVEMSLNALSRAGLIKVSAPEADKRDESGKEL